MFYNPYNFIPAPPRPTGPNAHSSLGDHAPAGHHRYSDDLWSGRITVRLTTKTPLLIPDAATATANERADGHKTFKTRLGPDGRPYLPPTGVKGMLRAAYEAVTNSRFGVFGKHDAPLGFRMTAKEGLSVVPAVMTDSGIRLLLGADDSGPYSPRFILVKGKEQWDIRDLKSPGRMYAAWMTSYEAGIDGFRPGSHNTYTPDGQRAAHGDEAWAWLSLKQHDQPTFQYWKVERLARTETDLGLATGGNWLRRRGIVCITNQNNGRKHDERFFFGDGHFQKDIPLNADQRKRWQDEWRSIVLDYRAQHAIDARHRTRPDQYLGHRPKEPAPSLFVYRPGAEELTRGTPCYVRFGPDTDLAALRANDIAAILPVPISRRRYRDSPIAVLENIPQGHLPVTPARSFDMLSPADRVFGWVRGSDRGSANDGPAAHRGQLSVGPVCCERADAVETMPNGPMPLAILGAPKPEQARFYSANDRTGGPVTSVERHLQKGDMYRSARGLRGRKVYPHQRTPPGYWSTTERGPIGGWAAREFRRPAVTVNPTDSQNRSIQDWIKPETFFTFDIHVTNLDDVELGALLWLLQQEADCHFKLGGGKPLGFGSVQLAVGDKEGSVDLATGQTWRRRYRFLTPERGEPKQGERTISRVFDDRWTAVVETYCNAVSDTYGQPFAAVSFVKGFLRAARGLGNAPTHYPRPTADSQGESYLWFVDNERENKRKSLPAITDDPGTLNYI